MSNFKKKIGWKRSELKSQIIFDQQRSEVKGQKNLARKDQDPLGKNKIISKRSMSKISLKPEKNRLKIIFG